MKLTFRLPVLSDEALLLDYAQEHLAHGENSLSASMGLKSMPYAAWAAQMQRNAETPNGDWGRSLTLLCFDKERLVGLLSVRPELTDELRRVYGDIGYGVRPAERKKGYASAMLQYALDMCRERGMTEVILGCYKDNIASVRTILRCQGRLIREEDSYTKERMSQYYSIALN